MLDLNENLLDAVISILKPFDEAMWILLADRTPSLHLVVAVNYQLLKRLGGDETDCESIQKLKFQLISSIEEHFPIHLLHQTASLLDPRVKSNLFLMTLIDRLIIIHKLKQLVTTRRQLANENVSLSSANGLDGGILSDSEPAKKRAKNNSATACTCSFLTILTPHNSIEVIRMK